MLLEGRILQGRSFEPVEGRVVVEDGTIQAVEAAGARSDDIILPAFVNAHTHVGDSVVKGSDSEATVGGLRVPPGEPRHDLLQGISSGAVKRGMETTVEQMEADGTAGFVDFRSGGVDGVRSPEDVVSGRAIDGRILGHGSIEALEASDGYGVNSATDGEFSKERRAAANAEKLFGVHAGEVDRTDINPALDLDPDFLVHMVHAEQLHLERIADSETPVVVCPRSNVTTNARLPPVRELLDRTTVALGTGHVLLNSPSMFREMAFTARLTDATPAEVLSMATVNGAELTGLDCGLIEKGRNAELVVLDGTSPNLSGVTDPRKAVVRRARAGDITEVLGL